MSDPRHLRSIITKATKEIEVMKKFKHYTFLAIQLFLIHSCFPCYALPVLIQEEDKPQGNVLEKAEENSYRLRQEYEYHCNTTSDINEHLPVLRNLAKECSSVVEIGVRSLVSTWGILQGLSENGKEKPTYLGIDLFYPPLDRLDKAKKLAEGNGVDFTFWRVNDLHIDLEPVDMLLTICPNRLNNSDHNLRVVVNK